MCSGDVTVDHWFNYAFTEPSFDPFNASSSELTRGLDWTEQYTDAYKRLTPFERSEESVLMWDTEHQCRDYDALWSWVKERELYRDGYNGTRYGS